VEDRACRSLRLGTVRGRGGDAADALRRERDGEEGANELGELEGALFRINNKRSTNMEKRLDMKTTNAQTVAWTDLCDELGAGPEGERVRAHGGELLERGAEALHERALAPRRERADERERKDLED